MRKIVKLDDLEGIQPEIACPLKRLLEHLLTEYKDFCSDSIETIGAIFVLESESDWDNFSIGKDSFEWIVPLDNTDFKLGCINIDTDRSINIVAESSLFALFEDNSV